MSAFCTDDGEHFCTVLTMTVARQLWLLRTLPAMMNTQIRLIKLTSNRLMMNVILQFSVFCYL